MEAIDRRRQVRLRFGEEVFEWGWLTDHPDQAQALFARHHGATPACLCVTPEIPIHITKGSRHFFLGRNPNTGSRHAWFCRFHTEPSNEWAVAGDEEPAAEAEQADPDVDPSLVLGDFPIGKHAPADPESSGPALRTLLERIWAIARFNRWTPSMAGKRGYWTVERYAPLAATELTLPFAEGASVASLLLVPPPFRGAQHSHEHLQTLESRLRTVETGANGGAFLVLGEIRAVSQTPYGHAVALKHTPYRDLQLYVSSAVAARDLSHLLDPDALRRREGGRYWLLGSVARSQKGNLNLLAAGVMRTTEELLPVDTDAAAAVVERLVQDGRRFARTLALGADGRPPVTLLLDAAHGRTVPLRVVENPTGKPGWEWCPEQTEMPAIPPPTPGELK